MHLRSFFEHPPGDCVETVENCSCRVANVVVKRTKETILNRIEMGMHET